MFSHISVLLNESIDGLNIKENGIYIDATLGGAGHSSEILKRIPNGKLYCFDKDNDAISYSNDKLAKIASNYQIIYSDFSLIKEKMEELGVNKVDGILFDIGVSSYQFDTPERGFSYNSDSRLDMRMDQNASLSAYEVVNNYKASELTSIFRNYGEEKFANQIANKIVKARELKPIETTFELVNVIKSALPSYVLNQKGHPAKQVFQAIRIEVNNELDSLKVALNKSLSMLNPGGRLVVITFHSLEDRIVKNLFREVTSTNDNVKGLASVSNANYKLVNHKVITASKDELLNNNRAHSAKLRIIEKI